MYIFLILAIYYFNEHAHYLARGSAIASSPYRPAKRSSRGKGELHKVMHTSVKLCPALSTGYGRGGVIPHMCTIRQGSWCYLFSKLCE